MSELPLRVLVVEDEELQRRQLATWLARDDRLSLVGEAATGPEAIELIDTLRPHVVLLDITLPGFSGLQVLEQITHTPEIVFTTAARDHAIRAFELGAVDYLLKPFREERLAAALGRVAERLRDAEESLDSVSERVAAVRDESEPLVRLFARNRNAVVPIPVESIVRIETDGDYTVVVANGRRHLISVPLHALHARIGRKDFVRVHRQHVVNLAWVKRFTAHDQGRLRIELEGGDAIIASRAGSQALRALIE